MAFFNMYIEQMLAGKVLAALKTPVSVSLVIVHLVFVVGSESQRLPVGRQIASHGYCIFLVVDGGVKLGEL
jgi:hypothetical protein